MTINQALLWGTQKLKESKLDSTWRKKDQFNSAQQEAEILLIKALSKNKKLTWSELKTYLYSHLKTQLSKKELQDYQRLINRRLNFEPIAYLLGRQEFFGFQFLVNRSVLIPRPESELLVEKALALIKEGNHFRLIADLGTGSGCLIISLAKILKKEFPSSKFQFYATEISPKALLVARKNTQLLKAPKIKFLRGDLLWPLKSYLLNQPSSLLILANLPYVRKKDYQNLSLSIKNYEPKIALEAGQDGLKYYRKLFQQIKQLKIKPLLLLEIDSYLKQKLKALTKNYFPQGEITFQNDLAHQPRLAIIKPDSI